MVEGEIWITIAFFLFSSKLQRYHHQSVKSTERTSKKIFESLPIMVWQQVSISTVERLKCLFHPSENTSFSNKLEGKAMVNILHKIRTM